MKIILFVTNMFPTANNPFFGIFIKEQIDSLKKFFSFNENIYFINGLHKSKFEYLKSIFLIPYWVIKHKPDFIHIHYGISGLFLLFFRPKVPVFLTLHGCDFQDHGDNRIQVWVSKIIAKKVDQIFVQNKVMKDLGMLINPNTQILTCGVDTEFFDPLKSDRLSFDKKVIVFPSNPSREEKNFPLFSKVIKQLESDLGENVIVKFIDKMSRSEIRDLLSSADCLVMTSISEGSPQVIKEALSCSLPVVSVPVGNVAEMIDGVPNCYVSSNYEVNELVKLVIMVLHGSKEGIRDSFLGKNVYDNENIAFMLAEYYQLPRI